MGTWQFKRGDKVRHECDPETLTGKIVEFNEKGTHALVQYPTGQKWRTGDKLKRVG